MDAADLDPAQLADELGGLADKFEAELIALRRDLHAHPELGRAEFRTTRLVRDRLTAAGLQPQVFPGGAGLMCDIGGEAARVPELSRCALTWTHYRSRTRRSASSTGQRFLAAATPAATTSTPLSW